MERTKKWHTGVAECVTNVFYYILTSSVIYLYPRHHRIFWFYMIPGENAVDGDVIYTSILQQITIENQSKYVYNCVSWFPFNENSKFPRICHHVSYFHVSVFQAFVARNFTCEPHLWIVNTSYHQLHPCGTEFFSI